MKAGGIRIVSTYIFWIHHEEIEGQFDWSGRRDLHRFVELAGKHGMYVWARVGPWDHGEVRNGGLPDWLLHKTKTRENDPEYLQYVRALLRRNRTAVGGTLLERRRARSSACRSRTNITRAVRAKAKATSSRCGRWLREAGIDAPFYSITGWDDAAIPSRGVIPGIRRLSGWLLVPAAGAAASQSALFLFRASAPTKTWATISVPNGRTSTRGSRLTHSSPRKWRAEWSWRIIAGR